MGSNIYNCPGFTHFLIPFQHAFQRPNVVTYSNNEKAWIPTVLYSISLFDVRASSHTVTTKPLDIKSVHHQNKR